MGNLIGKTAKQSSDVSQSPPIPSQKVTSILDRFNINRNNVVHPIRKQENMYRWTNLSCIYGRFGIDLPSIARQGHEQTVYLKYASLSPVIWENQLQFIFRWLYRSALLLEVLPKDPPSCLELEYASSSSWTDSKRFNHNLEHSEPFTPVKAHIVSPIASNSEDDSDNLLFRKGIKTIITWRRGGNKVSVVGSWDNWRSRRALHWNGNEHTICLVIPPGEYYYNFVVDGDWCPVPELPYVIEEKGWISNLLEVSDFAREVVVEVQNVEGSRPSESIYSDKLSKEDKMASAPAPLPEKSWRNVTSSTMSTS